MYFQNWRKMSRHGCSVESECGQVSHDSGLSRCLSENKKVCTITCEITPLSRKANLFGNNNHGLLVVVVEDWLWWRLASVCQTCVRGGSHAWSECNYCALPQSCASCAVYKLLTPKLGQGTGERQWSPFFQNNPPRIRDYPFDVQLVTPTYLTK